MRNDRLLILVIAAATLVGCGAPESDLGTLKSKRDSLMGVKADVASQIEKLEQQIALMDTSIERRYINVNVMPLSKKTFTHQFEVHGVVEADKVVEVYPEAAGRIRAIMVKEGQKVAAGQTLITLNVDVVVNQKKEVEGSLALAKDLFERQKKLWEEDKIGSEVEYLQSKNRFESLQSTLKALEAQIAMGVVRAPHDGIVDEIFAKVGGAGNPMAPVLRLVNTNQVYIETEVSEDYVGVITKGSKVSVQFPSIDYMVDTTVAYAGNYIDPGNRTFKVLVNLNNKKGLLKPNLLATMKVVDFEKESEFVIPSSAVMQDTEGKSYVYVVAKKEGELVARKVYLEVGKSNESGTLVISGLTGDEKLITVGARSVTDGEYIKIKS